MQPANANHSSHIQWEEAWNRRRSSFPPSTHPSTQSSNELFDFPPSDLVFPLLSLYFHQQNTIFPLLHAPTFYAQLQAGLHTRDSGFASVVWCCMAVASRWSTDIRVLWAGWGAPGNAGGEEAVKKEGEEEEWASAGWRFFLRSLGMSFDLLLATLFLAY